MKILLTPTFDERDIARAELLEDSQAELLEAWHGTALPGGKVIVHTDASLDTVQREFTNSGVPFFSEVSHGNFPR